MLMNTVRSIAGLLAGSALLLTCNHAHAATITLTAESTLSGYVWAQTFSGRYDVYPDDPHVGDESLGTSRGYLAFPITNTNLNGATINSVTLYVNCRTASSSSDYQLNVRKMRFSHSSAQDTWNDAGTGTVYCTSLVAGRSTGWQNMTIFSPGAADLQAMIAAYWSGSGEWAFPMGLSADGKGAAIFYRASTYVPYLIVDYTPVESIPNPPPILDPNAPDEPAPVNVPVNMRCGQTSSTYGHSLQYRFDYGDGSALSAWATNRTTTHTYSSAASFNFKAQARCATHTSVTSQWSLAFITRIRNPIPTLSTTSIDFGTIPINVARTNLFTLSDTAGYYTPYNNTVTFTWSVSDTQSWLSESPTSGNCKGSGSSNVSVIVSSSGLAYDTLYSNTVTITPSFGASKSVGVKFRTQPHTVSTPSTPSGSSPVATGSSHTYTSGGASCSVAGHTVQYRFDWGDGTFSSWSSSSSSSHSWGSPGTYQVKAQARCATDNAVVSSWSSAKSVSVVNHTVSTPNTPSGATTVDQGQANSYLTGGSSCSLGDSVEYRFSWGDATTSTWSSATSTSHAWASASTVQVKAQSRCASDTSVQSSWSGSFAVTVVAPFSLQGIVRDHFSGGQVTGATVEVRWIQGSSWTIVGTTNTDDNGRFSFASLSALFNPIEVIVRKSGYADATRQWFNPSGTVFLPFHLEPQTPASSRYTEIVNDFKDVWFEFPPDSPNVFRIHNNRDLYFGVQVIKFRGGIEYSTLLPASTANILGPKKYWLIESSAIQVTDPDPQIGDTYQVLLMHGDANGGPNPTVQSEVMKRDLEQLGRAIAGETLNQMGLLYPSEELLTKTKVFWDLYIFSDAISDSVAAGSALPFADAVVKKVFTYNKLYEQTLDLSSEEAALLSGSVRVLTVMPRFLDQIEHSSYRQARPHAYQYLALERVANPYSTLSLYTFRSGGGESSIGYDLPCQLYFNVEFVNATRRLTNVWTVVDLYNPLGTLVESTQLPIPNGLLGRSGAIQLTQQGQVLEAGATRTFGYVPGAPVAFSAPGYAEGDYLLTARVFENGYPGQVSARQIGPAISENLHFDDVAAPQPPETVTARRIDNGWIALSWDKIAANMEWGSVYDMDKYEVWRRVGTGTSQFLAFVDVDPLQGEPTILIDSNCTATTTYAYKVRAIDLDGRVGPFGNETIVNSNKLPSIAITSPANNAVFQTGTVVNISISSSDQDGSISQVACYLGGEVLQVFTQTPYSVSWSSSSQGVFTISAKAWDDQWMSSTSGTINVTIVTQGMHLVSAPSTPAGPSSGVTNQVLSFTIAGASCNQGHAVEYRFDWGDSSLSAWSSSTNGSHAWASASGYSVRAQARCAVDTNITSSWSAAKSVTITNSFTPSQSGAIRVNVAPPEAVTAGAQWRLDAGGWQTNGTLMVGISTGQHVVGFASLSGWTKPADTVTVVVANQTNILAGTYVLNSTGVVASATLYYRCDQSSGSTVLDARGNNNGALDNSNVYFNYSADLGRYCLKKSDDTEAGITPLFRPVSNRTFTISCWARPSAANDAASGQFFLIDSSPEMTYRLFTDRINYQYSDGGTYPQRNGTFTGNGGWHHYVWVNQDNSNGIASLRMSVDGNKLFDGQLSSTECNTNVLVSQKFLVQRPYSAFYYQFIGEICEIAVFDGKALTDAEISELNRSWVNPAEIDTDGDGMPDLWEFLQFGSITNANQWSDSDGDGLRDFYERLAGTNPKDSSSCLGIHNLPCVPDGNQGFVLQWYSITSKTYHVDRATSLVNGFTTLQPTNVPATPPMNVHTDSTATGQGSYFYKVRMDQ